MLKKNAMKHTHTHIRLTVLFPGLPRWAGTRKVKPIWILLKQETVGMPWKARDNKTQQKIKSSHYDNGNFLFLCVETFRFEYFIESTTKLCKLLEGVRHADIFSPPRTSRWCQSHYVIWLSFHLCVCKCMPGWGHSLNGLPLTYSSLLICQ